MGLCRIKATELIEDTPKLLQDSLCKSSIIFPQVGKGGGGGERGEIEKLVL